MSRPRDVARRPDGPVKPRVPGGDLVRLRPRPTTIYVAQGRSVLATDLDGFVEPAPDRGFFYHETRLASRLRWTIDGERPEPAARSLVETHSWMGYYIRVPPGFPLIERDRGSGDMADASQETLELRLTRAVGTGMHEDVDLTNFTQHPTRLKLALAFDADFADLAETRWRRQQRGTLRRSFRRAGPAVQELTLDYRVTRRYRNQGGAGRRSLRRGVVLRIATGSKARRTREGIELTVEIAPHGTWHACVDLIPVLDGERQGPGYRCRPFAASATHPFDRERERFAAASTGFEVPGRSTLTVTVAQALERARQDLPALRLHDLDVGPDAWTVAAGLPVFVALFGRDTLTASWQASLLTRELMRGTLPVLAARQGRRQDDWRDEQPGKMLHEAHTGPLALLDLNPRERYYGSITTSGFFPVVLAELWHWTGDEALVRPLIAPALRALEWLDRDARRPSSGFYEYLSRSRDGTKHQAWKDSRDAMVDEEGRPVEPPLATCEEQGFVYIAKLLMAEVLWWLDDKPLARRLHAQARDLKKRFQDAFWLEESGFVAMALDAQGQPVRSRGSNAGHCVATGILEDALLPRVAGSLFAPDLWSGWGIRTLSSDHPAYNPWSYHRGSVWPVEQASFATGFRRYGLDPETERLCRAQFEATRLFEHGRLPECFTGHPRDADHPFPSYFQESCSPQAWSASAVFSMVQAMLGIYPYAPLHLLVVDPHLPEWLPEITLRNLHVGEASADLRFRRRSSGRSEHEVLDVRGKLHVVRQPSPWSLTATFGERLRDALASLV